MKPSAPSAARPPARSQTKSRRTFRTAAALLLPVLAGISSGRAQDAKTAAPVPPAGSSGPVLFKKIQLSDKFYGEGATWGDFNKDGNADVASGPYWYEGPDFTKKHEIYAPKAYDPHGYSENFLAFTYDFNKDAYPDVLVAGFPGKEGVWYENPQGKDEPWKKHVVFNVVDNESPGFVDVDGDGRPDLLCTTEGKAGYATFDLADAAKPWTFHAVSPKKGYQRFTHGIGAGDVNNDGKTDILFSDGWYEQPAAGRGEAGRGEAGRGEAGEWKFHSFKFAAEASQMYAYDVDGDGKNDVICANHAHGYGLQWWKNAGADDKGEIKWEKHVILGATAAENPYGVKFSQLHAVDLADMDGDGLKDLVTGKRWWAHGPGGDAEPAAPAVLYWFRLVRGPGGPEFVPYKLDDDSGVGTQVLAGGADPNHKLPNIVVGNKKGTFVHVNLIDQAGKDAVEKLKPQTVEKPAK